MKQYPENLSYIEKSYIAQWISTEPIIVESGAHKGRDTLALKAMWPKSIIHAFEPVSALFEELCLATKQLENVYCYPLGLSEKSGEKTLYVSNKVCTAISSLCKPLSFFKKGKEVLFTPTIIETLTLDDWAYLHNIKLVDLLWLDMQGVELSVLKASNLILKTVKAIHMEVNLERRYEQIPLYPEIKMWIETQGFTIVAEAFYRKSWGNILCIRL